MGVLDKIFGKKQEIQPPTIPVSDIQNIPSMVQSTTIPSMPSASPATSPASASSGPMPSISDMMNETVARPLEPSPIMSSPVSSPSLEERALEDVPKDIFVKLDSFGDVLTEMTILRSSLVNIKSLALIQGEMWELSNDINNLVKAYSDEFESSLSNLETIIEGVSGAAKKAKEVKFKAAKPVKAKAVEDLEARIKKLRTEIEGVKKK